MKKLLFIASLFATANLFGQAIINGDFESWDSIPYSQPANYWYTSNFMSLIQYNNVANVTQVTGFSGSAVHLQTYLSAGDTDFGFIQNTPAEVGNPMAGQGGQPYSQKSTGITGYFRYSLPVNDTAILLLVFKKSGSIVGEYIYKIRGSGSQLSWTSFSYTFTPALSATPDSVIIAFASSNAITNKGMQNGSWLELDQLAFTGPNTAIPDGNFDTWNNYFYYQPIGWTTGGGDPNNGPGIIRTTNHYKGNYAISLLSMPKPPSSVNDAFITNGKRLNNGPIVGGQPYTGMSDTLEGYYEANDSNSNAQIQLTKNGVNVGYASLSLPKAASWTHFKLGFLASSTPDTIQISFFSSSLKSNGILILDNIQLKSQPLGVFDPSRVNIGSLAYPNPANTILNIQLDVCLGRDAYILVYDVSGRIVKNTAVSTSENILHLNVADLKTGIYFYKIETPAGPIINQFIKN